MWRAASIAGLIALNVATALTTADDATRPLLPWGLILIAGSAVVLHWRERFPYAVLLLTSAVTLLYYPLGFPDAPIVLTLIIALYTVARDRGPRPAISAAVLLLAAFVLIGRRWEAFLGTAPILLLPVILGELARSRARRTAEALDRARLAEASRESEAQRRAAEERLRIARDLHDVLGHQLSLISVQAGAALHTREPAEAFAALREIRTASTEALREMRSVLRATDQPGLAALPELFDRMTTAGLPVRATVDPAPAPAVIEQAAYRIVQEALTNAMRHAVSASRVDVDIHQDGDQLVLTIANDGDQVVVGPGGSGLPGMAARAAAAGGDCEAGPLPGGGFRVRASLPLREGGTR
ncbi:two-component sensor histidine kinase [Actinoplanes sp. OR16]|uniref:sensor histidine kinase n=1 Tax=Actinoplanes sp. OR16 TaxID=946334 RepID=UPI000F70D501|nr:histidine kinase [Actinoplanes sp. OR16]BBH71742.1 two-component sensor histidine kinase [Actinoplanes sp. OR16]